MCSADLRHNPSVTARSALIRSVFVAAAVFGAAIVFVLGSPATAGPLAARGGCAVGTGVTVVVDSSDLGGSIETGCAIGDPATGRAALSAAGFTAVDGAPGLICAIDARPEPCPATFQGEYWSYWHAKPGQSWTSYQVGADSSTPVRGEVEGWRYGNGAVEPGITSAAAVSPVAPVQSHAPGHDQSAPSAVDGTLVVSAVAGAALILLIIAAIVLRARRREASGPDGSNDRGGHDERD